MSTLGKPTQSNADKHAILVISSHVVRGTVGNRAVAFALEALGHPSWVLPTVTLAWHPGHGQATRIVAGEVEFSNLCADLANAPWRDEISGIISGFMANASQVEAVGNLVTSLKNSNPDLAYLCDPVIGDIVSQDGGIAYGNQGQLYIDETVASSIGEILLPLADISTPNLFELGWLDGLKTAQNQVEMLVQAKNLATKYQIGNLLVTSVPGLMRANVGSVLVNDGNALMGEHKALDNPPNGLGDLTSALFMSHFLNGKAPRDILEKTTASVFEVLARTAQDNADELALESNIISLSRPMAMVNMRALK